MSIPKSLSTVTPFTKLLSLIILLVFISAAFLTGHQWRIIEENNILVEKRVPTPTPSWQRSWKTYQTEFFSIRYPKSWIAANYYDSTNEIFGKNKVRIFNPATMNEEYIKGQATGLQIPSQSITIATVKTSQSPKILVDNIEDPWIALGNKDVVKYINRIKFQVSEASAEAYIEPGDITRGRIILISNKKTIAQIITSENNIKDKNKIENQIISTFKFLY